MIPRHILIHSGALPSIKDPGNVIQYATPVKSIFNEYLAFTLEHMKMSSVECTFSSIRIIQNLAGTSCEKLCTQRHNRSPQNCIFCTWSMLGLEAETNYRVAGSQELNNKATGDQAARHTVKVAGDKANKLDCANVFH